MEMEENKLMSTVEQILDQEVLSFLDGITKTCAERDKKCEPISREDLATPAAKKILSASIPKEFGGAGLNFMEWGRVLEEIGRVCEDGSFGLLISMFPAVANTIIESKNEYLIDRYAKGILDGSTFVSFAYTEKTDAFNFQTRLMEDGDDVIISGEKVMLTGGSLANAFMTYVARDGSNELDVVMIDARDEGVELEPLWTMGLRSSGFAKITLNNVRIPANRLLVKNGGGLSHAQNFLNPRRSVLSSWSVGRIARTINLCSDYVNRTIRYNNPLSSYGPIQVAFGDMRIAYESAKIMVRSSLNLLTANQLGLSQLEDDHTSAAKYRCVEAGLLITQKCFELMGGAAYCHPNPIERYVRDGLGSVSGAGAQDIVKFNTGVKTLFDSL
jgi:alkylation response protein AidB-like acyl-CoA dehydrogenase